VRIGRCVRSATSKKSGGLVGTGHGPDTPQIFAYMKSQAVQHRVSAMSWVMEVSRSGFYTWASRRPSPRARENAELGRVSPPRGGPGCLVARRSLVVSIASSSGKRLPVGWRARTLLQQPVSRQAVDTRWFRDAGGMSPVRSAPPSERYLSFADREEIGLLNAQNFGVRAIARKVGRSPSTIWRELRRNAATRSGDLAYRATAAQWHADSRSRRAKVAKLAGNDALRQHVQERISGITTTPDGAAVPGPQVPLDWTTPWSPTGPTLGERVESGADLLPAAARFPR
jgi:hypothetical protein